MWTTFNLETPLDFAEMGIDRRMPHWEQPDWSLPILNLGAGEKTIPGTVSLDWPEWNAETDAIPYGDGSIGGIFATHFLEHIADPTRVLAEASRVLAPLAPFNILVPHGQSLLYQECLDHKSPFVIESWKNLMDDRYWKKHSPERFRFNIGANFLFGLKEENLCLVTQLIRKDDASASQEG
jgi:SAM-dependent methyltransferase